MRDLRGYDGPIGYPGGGVRPFGRVLHDPVTAITGGASIISGFMGADAAGDAADAQAASSAAGQAEMRRQFDAVQKLLQPYVNVGTSALAGQQAILGIGGSAPSYEAIEGSPAFASMMRQGEEAILQNASATGGLRGGNTQAALAQFRPTLLSSLINQQYERLGGLASLGQNAAAGVGNAGMATGNNVAQLMQQSGAAQAGGIVGRNNAIQSAISGVGQAAGYAWGRGGGGSSYLGGDIPEFGAVPPNYNAALTFGGF